MVRLLLVMCALCIWWSQALAEKRVALIIGNAVYAHASQLSNPANDAKAMAKVVEDSGFALVGGHYQVNLTKHDLGDVLKQFAAAATDADVVFFYFSGHGMQINGSNYLVAADSDIARLAEIPLEALNVDLVMGLLAQSHARLKIVLLDACRNNPFLASTSKDLQRGLARMEAPAGTLIGFATQPNMTAADGPPETNSPYAAALVHNIPTPGREIFAIFNDAGLEVMARTNNAQQPWIQASPIQGRFYFKPPVVAVPSTVTQGGIATTQPTAPPSKPVQIVVTPYSTGAALAYVQQANVLLGNRNYADARSVLTKAIQAEPNSSIARSYRGFAWSQEGIDAWDRAIAADATTKRNAALAALEDYKTAFLDLDEAIKLDPTYAPPRRHRGRTILYTYMARSFLHMAVNDILEKAIIDLKAAADMDPTSKLNAKALGDAYVIRGHYQAAVESYSKAISLDSKYADAYAGRCAAYAGLGDRSAAEHDASIAADRASEHRSRSCLRQSARR